VVNDKKSSAQWRLIVVGGHTRSIGKTQLVCDVISAFRPANWIAGKITQYGHGVCAQNGENCDCAPDEHVCAINWEVQADTGTDSARFLQPVHGGRFGSETKQGFLAEGLPLLRAALTRDTCGCQGRSATPDCGEQFLAAVSEAQPLFLCGRSGEGRFQGFGSRSSGPRGCSSAARIVGFLPIDGTGLDEASLTIASRKNPLYRKAKVSLCPSRCACSCIECSMGPQVFRFNNAGLLVPHLSR